MRLSCIFSVRNTLFCSAVLGLLFATQPALAKDSGGFVGGSVGLTSYDICGDLTAIGATSCDDEDTGFKIFGGYKFNPNFALEGGYADFGEITASALGATAKADADALFFSAIGAIPLGNRFALFGKLGVFLWDGTISATGPGGSESFSEDGTDILFGAGLSYDFMNNFGIRGEWERYDLDGDDVDMLSVGIQFMF